MSFELERGETLGLVGESGCGKSTLVQTVLLLERPTGGQILFNGAPVTMRRVRELRRRVQVVFQDPYTSLPARMRVGDIIADPLLIHRIGTTGAIRARVRELLKEVGLPADHPPEPPANDMGGRHGR